MTRTPDTNETDVPTLADVARHAGVSTATVSRCLNSPDQVQKDTRDRVLDTVKQLGYSPNFSARALAAKRTNTIGAIIPTMDNAIFARGLQAFQEELGKSRVNLLVASSSYQPDLEAEQIRNLVARGADGLLLIGHQRDPSIYTFLDKRRVPVLVAWAFDASNPRPSIGFDNQLAMHEMAEQVIARGHRRIAIISARQADNDRARERVFGAQAAMKAAGMEIGAMPLIETQYSIAHGADAFRTLMTAPTPPTAVICGNDVLAVGALQQAHTMGLDVPGDVSITGFDDIELAEVTTPMLTTVHVPHREMGRRAAHLLWEMVNSGDSAKSIRLDTFVQMRGTLGPPTSKV